MNKLDAKNKDAALNIYADLCEVRNYTKVTANLAKEIGFIYFEACPKLNDTNTELIFPIDEFDPEFNLDVIYQLVAEINEIHKPKSEINKIKVGITSSDFTTVYYDFTLGVDSPFNREQLKRESNPLGN